ncbi:MAG: 50S ribosomal protein L11 methyltransferase [Myxococcota bacterium]
MIHELEHELGAFGSQLHRRRPPLCPELELWLLGDDVDLEVACDALPKGVAPPFWAFCWGSGQALARFLLDRPDLVQGKRIVDLGAGSGIAGLAAARAGAARVVVLDRDPRARLAAQCNAELNGLEIEASHEIPGEWDLMLAADVLFESGLRSWLLGPARQRGPILLADPERAGAPRLDQRSFARIEATTFPNVDFPRKNVALHWFQKLDPLGAASEDNGLLGSGQSSPGSGA